MAVEVAFGEDPGWVLSEAGAFLASDPVRHNLILALLHARVAYPEAGRYWGLPLQCALSAFSKKLKADG